jgi:hypothetical protein
MKRQTINEAKLWHAAMHMRTTPHWSGISIFPPKSGNRTYSNDAKSKILANWQYLEESSNEGLSYEVGSIEDGAAGPVVLVAVQAHIIQQAEVDRGREGILVQELHHQRDDHLYATQ